MTVSGQQREAQTSDTGGMDHLMRIDGTIKGEGQDWFWTPEWQAGELEASAEIAAGRVQFFETESDFLSSLED